MLKMFSSLIDPNEREIGSLKPLVEKINKLEPKIQEFSDDELRAKTGELKQKLNGVDLRGAEINDHLPEAFAICREGIQRTVGQRAFDVQLMAGIVLHQGKIAEQKTGEGKTHSATFALFLNSLSGKGVHSVTVNDYLSRRDAGWYGKALNFLGISVGCIIHDQAFLYDPAYTDTDQIDERLSHLRPVSRQEAYTADVTYGTNNEFGFDYLRDNMVADTKQMVQRGHYFAVVDEVDSILIDEARTPLIISSPAEEAVEKYYDFARLASQLTAKTDFVIDEKHKTVNLTEIGIRKVERILGVENLYEKDFETVHHVEAALKAQALFQRDRDYVVKDNEVIIVDEFTGRLMLGRRYSEGLHQAIEAKEGVPIQRESKTLATVSFQNLFRMYKKLAGMTGTAATEAEEFAKIYKLDVVIMPTHLPMVRKDNADFVYKTERGKYQAIVNEIADAHEKGQPVLVGTTSIEKNELVAKLLDRKNIPYQLLNAKNHEKEAQIISQAGKFGSVTVATNMAGRGVDIKLGGDPQNIDEYEKIKGLGGLYVIGTERHEARRIDNQLRGRSGRQGDSGQSRFFVSLQDDLMRIFGGDQVAGLMTRMGIEENMPIEAGMVSRAIENAQKKVEGHNFDIRKHLVEYDDVMNKQREIVYAMRTKILETPIESVEDFKIWLLGKISPASPTDTPQENSEDYDQLWTERESQLGKDIWFQIVRQISLQTIDILWMDHIDTIDDLRQGIGLRGYGAREPLVEYQREARVLFDRLMAEIWGNISDRLFKSEFKAAPVIPTTPQRNLIYQKPEIEVGVKEEAAEIRQQTPMVKTSSIGRNDPCWCGSGKKWKKCHYPDTGQQG